MKFTGQIRIPDLDHPGVPATFLIDGTQAEVILEGEESLGRWSLFDVQARRLISAAFQVELDDEEVTFIADEPIDFAYRGLEEMAQVWARFKSMNIVRRKVAVSRSRSGVQPSRIHELRAAMEENLGVRAKSVSLPGTSGRTLPSEASTGTHVWDRTTRQPVADDAAAAEPSPIARSEPEPEPTIPVVTPPAKEAADTPEDGSDEATDLAAELETIEEQKSRLEEKLRATEEESDEVAATLAAERKAIEEERARLAEERKRLEELHREAERREEDRVEAFRLEMQRLDRERKEFEKAEEQRQLAHREAMERLEAERSEIEQKTAEMSQREQKDAERADELQTKLAELEQERARREQEESERVEAARREIAALEEQQRRMESLEELTEESGEIPDEVAEPSEVPETADVEEGPVAEEAAGEPEPVALPDEVAASADSKVVDLAELEEGLDDLAGERPEDDGDKVEDEDKTGPKHLRQTSRRRRAGGKQDQQPDPETASEPEPEPQPVADLQPEPEPQPVADLQPEPEMDSGPEIQPDRQPEPAMAGAAKQSGIMGAVRAAFGRGGREHVHDFVEAPGGLGIARSICRECGYVSISTED